MAKENGLLQFNINKEQFIHLDSNEIPIIPNFLYELQVPVIGFTGNAENVFFAIIFLDDKKNEISRKIRNISDFSGKLKNYFIVAQSPNNSKYAKLILRLNSETKSNPTDINLSFPDVNSCSLNIVKNKPESFDNITDYEKFWKRYDKNCYRYIVMPKTKKDFESLGSYYDEQFRKFDINYYEGKKYSQNGEDGIIEFIFSLIGETNKIFVEFGVEDGTQCNSRYLIEKGWTGLMMDSQASINPLIKKEFVTAENIDNLLTTYNIPKKFDLISIDVDYNDYWIWKGIKNFSPRVVVIEYNSTIPSNESKVVEYQKEAIWDGTNYFGASLAALTKLGNSKGYTLVGCDNHGVNAFFIKDEIVKDRINKKTIKELYRPPKFGKIINGKCVGHGKSTKEMIEV